MARAHLGLVLRAQSVEVVEACRTFGGAVMTKAVRVPIEGPEDSHVVLAIQTALRTAQSTAPQIGVTVLLQDTLLRSFVMPHWAPSVEWAAAVQYEVRKYIPFKLDELVWDFHVVEERAAKQLTVVVAGMRTEAFARIQGWFTAAGVRPAWIEAPWAGLARLVPRPKKGSPKDCVVVVDVDAHAAHVVVTKGRIPVLARDVSLAGASEGPGEGEAALDPVERLLSELRLSIDFFTREDPAAVIKHVVLFGDSGLLASWRNELSAKLRYPVELGAMPVSAGSAELMDLGFALAASVACRSLRPSPIRLDLSERPASRTISRPQALELTSLLKEINPELVRAMEKPAKLQAVIALAVLAGLAALTHQQVGAARQQLARALQTGPDVGHGLDRLTAAELQAKQLEAEQYRAVLRRAVRERVSVTKKLEALARVTPEGVWFESVSYRGSLNPDGTSQLQLALRGACFRPKSGQDLETIHEFVQRIKQDPELFRGFAVSQLGQITQQQDRARQMTYRTFDITCQSGGGG